MPLRSGLRVIRHERLRQRLVRRSDGRVNPNCVIPPALRSTDGSSTTPVAACTGDHELKLMRRSGWISAAVKRGAPRPYPPARSLRLPAVGRRKVAMVPACDTATPTVSVPPPAAARGAVRARALIELRIFPGTANISPLPRAPTRRAGGRPLPRRARRVHFRAPAERPRSHRRRPALRDGGRQ